MFSVLSFFNFLELSQSMQETSMVVNIFMCSSHVIKTVAISSLMFSITRMQLVSDTVPHKICTSLKLQYILVLRLWVSIFFKAISVNCSPFKYKKKIRTLKKCFRFVMMNNVSAFPFPI
jgi:hypothetical protein